jgi:hypothetical protein
MLARIGKEEKKPIRIANDVMASDRNQRISLVSNMLLRQTTHEGLKRK